MKGHVVMPLLAFLAQLLWLGGGLSPLAAEEPLGSPSIELVTQLGHEGIKGISAVTWSKDGQWR